MGKHKEKVMDKIEELKEKLKGQLDYLAGARMVVSGTEEIIEQTIQDIAELEAESAKPREFVISLHRDGRYVCCSANVGRLLTVGDGSNPEIPVIEKKTITVTREMASKFYNAFNSMAWGVVVFQPERLTAGLNAIGIDAVAGE